MREVVKKFRNGLSEVRRATSWQLRILYMGCIAGEDYGAVSTLFEVVGT